MINVVIYNIEIYYKVFIVYCISYTINNETVWKQHPAIKYYKMEQFNIHSDLLDFGSRTFEEFDVPGSNRLFMFRP